MEPKMSLAKKWKESPVISLLIVCLTIGSGVFGVTEFFHAQRSSGIRGQYDAKIAELQTQLAAVNLNVANGHSLGVDSLILKTGAAGTIPANSDFFKTESFYAPKTTSFWNYQSKTEGQMYRDFGIQLQVDKQVQNAANQIPIHMWTADQNFSILHDGENLDLKPMIVVQRMTDQQMAMTLGIEAAPKIVASMTPEKESLSSIFQNASFRKNNSPQPEVANPSSQKQVVFDALREDRAGKYFQMLSFMQLQSALASPNTSYLLNQLQKDGDVVHGQSSLVLRKAIVNGQNIDIFYLHFDEIYIADSNGLYIIRMTVPSTEPVVNQELRAEMIGWLQGFRVIQK
jgi:hypothetical protein